MTSICYALPLESQLIRRCEYYILQHRMANCIQNVNLDIGSKVQVTYWDLGHFVQLVSLRESDRVEIALLRSLYLTCGLKVKP